ncbi:MAG: tryptophan halogenase family protein [Parvularcula sp.]|jgi:tryptophan halogenase|nr:tryptophan halogenase family protein [Parvularcula sp.]
MTEQQAPLRIVIAGGGTAGWMAAAALSRGLPRQRTVITLVESDAIGTVGVGEATIPAIVDFNRTLGIDEADFLRSTNGTYKLGIEFVGWGAEGERYFHPFGVYGFDLDGTPFHHHWLRLRQAGEFYPYGDYSISWVAARSGKFMHPVSDVRSPLSQLRYAFHFDAGAYAAYLRAYAEERGVVRLEGRIGDVDLNADGDIASLTIDDGRQIEGDVFIDCTGFRGLLIGEAMGTSYRDWSHWLPCDRAVAVPTASGQAPLPCTRATARKAGWQWQIPLQHRTGNGYVYSSAFTNAEDATATLLAEVDGSPLAEPRLLRFTTGRREAFWVRNCVAIGLSAGFLEPLESTSIHLIQEGVTKLIALLDERGGSDKARTAYNSLLAKRYDTVRNFLIAHYHLNARDGEPFWDYVREMSIPDELSYTLELFKDRGAFFGYEGDLFNVTSWTAMLLGQNLMPQGQAFSAETVPLEQLRAAVADMRRVYAQAGEHMPRHAAYLARQGASADLHKGAAE